MAEKNCGGTWQLHARRVFMGTGLIIRVSSGDTWTISKNNGWKLNWKLNGMSRPNDSIQVSSENNPTSFILHLPDTTPTVSLRVWMIDDKTMLGVATEYSAANAALSCEEPWIGIGPDDVDVFVAMRGGDNGYPDS